MGLFNRRIELRAQTVRPGDAVFVSVPDLPADQDAVALIRALQAQFPRNRVHLFVGAVVEIRNGNRSQSDDRADDPLEVAAEERRTLDPNLRQQGRIEVGYASRAIVSLVSIPPEETSDPVKER